MSARSSARTLVAWARDPGTTHPAAAVLRIAAGIVFLAFGPGKFIRHAAEAAAFARYGIPLPDVATYAVGALEIAGGLALVLGLLVRPVALILARQPRRRAGDGGPNRRRRGQPRPRPRRARGARRARAPGRRDHCRSIAAAQIRSSFEPRCRCTRRSVYVKHVREAWAMFRWRGQCRNQRPSGKTRSTQPCSSECSLRSRAETSVRACRSPGPAWQGRSPTASTR